MNITLVLTAMALIFLSTTSVFHLEELYTQIREIADKAHKDSKISFKNKNFWLNKDYRVWILGVMYGKTNEWKNSNLSFIKKLRTNQKLLMIYFQTNRMPISAVIQWKN